jgi:hypothetical protein
MAGAAGKILTSTVPGYRNSLAGVRPVILKPSLSPICKVLSFTQSKEHYAGNSIYVKERYYSSFYFEYNLPVPVPGPSSVP